MAVLRALALAVLLAATCASAASVGVGDPAPDVAFTDWSGRPVRLADQRGRVVVLDFWASWCATCRVALPGVDAIAHRHPNAVVLAANIDASQAPADRFLAERLPDPAVTLVHDPDGDVLARFGASGMPAIYVIDRDGVVRFAAAGYDPGKLADIERTLENVLGARGGGHGESMR